jgi:prepilin-type N-terminal cleavage/methylation domain-containing protein
MSNRKGFTLIELLIVVVIIGILAAIAIPKFAATKDKARLASVKSDIRNIETAEEAYFADNAAYGVYGDINGANLFTSSAGNVATITVVGAGYTVSVTNSTITQGEKTCAVAIGQGAATDGEITCS